MIKFKFQSNLSQVVYRWPQLFINGSRNGLKEYLTRLVTEAQLIFGMPNSINNKTGRLRKSIKRSGVKKVGDVLEGTVGSKVIYAPVHEFGAKITAKKGKYLIFKLSNRSLLLSKKWSWRITPNREETYKKVRKKRIGNTDMKIFTFGKERYKKVRKKEIGVTDMTIFTPSVTIPARPYLSRALDNTKEGGARMIQDAIIKELNR